MVGWLVCHKYLAGCTVDPTTGFLPRREQIHCQSRGGLDCPENEDRFVFLFVKYPIYVPKCGAKEILFSLDLTLLPILSRLLVDLMKSDHSQIPTRG